MTQEIILVELGVTLCVAVLAVLTVLSNQRRRHRVREAAGVTPRVPLR